jgi:transmembrane sensor
MKAAQGTAGAPISPHLRAAEWLTRLRTPEEMTALELRSWQQFIAVPENREAFECIQRVAKTAPTLVLSPLPEPHEWAAQCAEDTYDASLPVEEWDAWQGAQRGTMLARLRGWAPRWQTRSLLAASAVIIIAVTIWLSTARLSSTHRAFHTEGAQHRVVTLDDGSRITLGAKTALEVRYTRKRRLIYLQHGEALFTVARDLQRPFVVFAGTGSVTAVGTEFNIWREMDRTRVTVTEGIVDVEAATSAGAQALPVSRAARVKKGQEITYAQGRIAEPVHEADLSSAIAWREGRLVYRETPLKYVISDVNRYFPQQLVIVDAEIGELEFSGAVPQTLSPVEFVSALERIFRLKAVRVDEQRILIRSLPPLENKLPVVKS